MENKTRVGTQCKTHYEISVDRKRSVVINEILEEDVDGEWLQYFQVIQCEANRWYSADTLIEAKWRAADLTLGLGVSRGRYPFKLGEDLERWEIEIWGNQDA